MSIFKQLATIRDLTGWTPRLRVEETIELVGLHDDKVWVTINRARTSDRRNGYVVTQRGITTVLFNRDPLGVWHRDEVTVWHDPLPPEHVVTWPGRTPSEHAERVEWEELAHRPGTRTSPQDNADRRAQGYDWYPQR